MFIITMATINSHLPLFRLIFSLILGLGILRDFFAAMRHSLHLSFNIVLASSYSKILQLLVLRHAFRGVQRKSLSSLSTLSFSMKCFYYLVILQLSVSMPFCHSVILSLCHSAMRQSVLSSLGPSVILLILSICNCAIL